MAFSAPRLIHSRDDAINLARAAGRLDAERAAGRVYADATELDARTLSLLGSDWRDDLRLTAEYVGAYSQAFQAELERVSPAAARARKLAAQTMVDDAQDALDAELATIQRELAK